MRRRNKKPQDDSDIDMTPMLDIVFIMLIFFIVTAVFLDEKGIDLTPPPPPPEQEPTEPKPAIVVYIDERDFCSVDGRGTDCDRVTLVVEGTLGEKPGANIILRVNELATHGNLVYLKDAFDQKGLSSKIEIIPAG